MAAAAAGATSLATSVRRDTSRCTLAPSAASRSCRWYPASPIRCPSHSASSDPTSAPPTSAASTTGPRALRARYQAPSASSTPTTAPRMVNQLSSATNPSGSGCVGYHP
jgi:hypothetical protein